MTKWFVVGFAMAAAAAYVFWSRRSAGMTEQLESATSRARDYASGVVDRAGDVAGDVASKASEQLDRARDAVGAGGHASRESGSKRL